MIKVLHAADIHLDTPFNIGDIQKSQIMRNEHRGAFSSLMTLARIEKYDIVLIAGDMFDSSYITPDTLALVMREFRSCRDCRIVISPGNHDPFTPDSVWAKNEFPDNVYIFDSDKISCFHFDDINTDVYGYAFTSQHMNSCPICDTPEINKDRINLLCAHGDLYDGNSLYCPIKTADLLRVGFDYAAFGHIHNSDGIRRNGNTWYGYSGCLNAHGFDECGYKGAVIATMSKDNGVFEASVRGKRFSKRRFENETVDLTGSKNDDEVLERIGNFIREKHYGEDTLLSLTLTGSVSPDVTLSDSAMLDFISQGLFHASLKNCTDPLFGSELLASDPTVRGAFFNALLPNLSSGQEETRNTAAAALRYGLSALRGNDIL